MLFAFTLALFAQLPEVDTAAVLRRGDSVSYVDGVHAGVRSPGNVAQRLFNAHPDQEKFFVTVVTGGDEDADALAELLAAWQQSRKLLAFADPDDAETSWAHFRVYSLTDASQSWRFRDAVIPRTPCVLLQACRSGAWGDPSVVISRRTWRGNADGLAADLSYALQLWAERLEESPPPRTRAPWRAPAHGRYEPAGAVIGRESSRGGIGAPLDADSDFPNRPHGSPLLRGSTSDRVAPWRVDAKPPTIARDRDQDGFDDDAEQCPGPYCPNPQPRPQPNVQPDQDDWTPPNSRPNRPKRPRLFPPRDDDDGADFPRVPWPRRERWTWEQWALYGMLASLAVTALLFLARVAQSYLFARAEQRARANREQLLAELRGAAYSQPVPPQPAPAPPAASAVAPSVAPQAPPTV